MRRHEFLETPRDIRAQLTALLRRTRRLDVAVAFVGRDWQEILRDLPVRTRLVCWLSSTNTNPFAVEEMIDAGVKVRHHDAMHAKVYLAPGHGAIVGSANLSMSALSDAPVSLQHEAAVLLGGRELPSVGAWFESLWVRARAVTRSDLASAKRAWEAARKLRRRSQRRELPREVALPDGWRPPSSLVALAGRVRRRSVWEHVTGRQRAMGAVRPGRITKASLSEIIAAIAEWTGHIGAYSPAKRASLGHVRDAFALVFDDDEDIARRLDRVAPAGDMKLPGFGLNVWTLLLYWRNPRRYVPFNAKTRHFLESFRLASLVPSTISPASYVRWSSLAAELRRALRLPSIGHVDLIAWEHWKDTHPE